MSHMTSMLLPITTIYAGIFGLLLLVLSALVVRQRGRRKVGLGDGGDPDMQRIVRAHGNFTEFVPLILILMGVNELAGYPVWVLHGIGVWLIVARVAHAQGLVQSSGTSRGRFIGASSTFLILGIASLLALFAGLK